MKNISSGIFVDGLGGVIPGLIGGFGQSTSSANVGLSIASGATSKKIAYSLGLILFFLAFFPKLSGIFIIMPKPVMGAMLVFTISFMIMSGLQILTSRMLDTRKTLIAGFSIIFGLSADILPELYEGVHPWISPVFASSLSLGTTMAVVLNLLLRIGIKRHAKLVVESSVHASNVIFDFFEKQGGIWGARKEVVYKVITAGIELSESIYGLGLTSGKIEFRTVYSEESIELTATYEGAPIDLEVVKPTSEELIANERASLTLARYLVRHSADQVEISSKDDRTSVKMYFTH